MKDDDDANVEKRTIEISHNFGCLGDILLIILVVAICDISGCEWSNGFCHRIYNSFTIGNQNEEFHPSDFR